MNRIPLAGDDLYFNALSPSPNAEKDCDGLGLWEQPPSGPGGEEGGEGQAGGTYIGGLKSINILDPYPGTVTFSVGQSVETFRLEAPDGAISQPGPSRALTVSKLFKWTAGILNSSDYLSTVSLTGGTGLFEPLSEGVVQTGSNIQLGGQNQSTAKPGTTTFNNGSGFSATGDSKFQVDAGNSNPGNQNVPNVVRVLWENPDEVTYGRGTISISGNAVGTVIGPGTWRCNGLGISNAGTFEIKDFATVTAGTFNFLGQPGGKAGGVDPDYYQSAGNTIFHPGSTSKPLNGHAGIEGGNVKIVSDAPVGVTAPAILDGKLRLDGSTVRVVFESPGEQQLMWTFVVNDEVTWNQAQYEPRVNAAVNANNDTWLIRQKLTMGAGAKMKPNFFNSAGGLNVNFRWAVIDAEQGIAPPPAAQAPTAVASNAAYNIYKVAGAGPGVRYEVGA